MQLDESVPRSMHSSARAVEGKSPTYTRTRKHTRAREYIRTRSYRAVSLSRNLLMSPVHRVYLHELLIAICDQWMASLWN